MGKNYANVNLILIKSFFDYHLYKYNNRRLKPYFVDKYFNGKSIFYIFILLLLLISIFFFVFYTFSKQNILFYNYDSTFMFYVIKDY